MSNKKLVRIVERTLVGGRQLFVIQRPHALLWWRWVDATRCAPDGEDLLEIYPNLDDARARLCHYDGSKTIDRVVVEVIQVAPVMVAMKEPEADNYELY